MDWLLPITGYSFFDVWTLVHLAFWIFVGSTLWAFHLTKWVSLACCLTVAFAWEIVENVMAPLHPEIWKDSESLWNAWISDPLTTVVGVLGIYWLLNRRKRARDAKI
jgi:hypothetical protein